MKRTILFSTALVATAYALACTNFIVGKKASVDGSVICTYNADSYGAFMNLAHYPAARHQKGDMRKIYEWDTNKFALSKIRKLFYKTKLDSKKNLKKHVFFVFSHRKSVFLHSESFRLDSQSHQEGYNYSF